MKKNISFSVIVPVFNAEKYLADCLNSLDEQTYSNFEILCINDGSTDRSSEMLQMRENSRLKVFQQENLGVSATRNRAIELATGDYILFLDSDDWLHPKTLECLCEQLNQTNYPDLVLFPHISVYPTKEVKSKALDALLARYGGGAFTFDDSKSLLVYAFGGVGGKLYKRDLLNRESIRFQTNLSFSEDIVFNLEVYARCKSITVVERALYFYRKTLQGDTLSTKRISAILDSYQVAVNKLTSYYHAEILLDRFAQTMLYTVKRPDFILEWSDYRVLNKVLKEMRSHPTPENLRSYSKIKQFMKSCSLFKILKRKIKHLFSNG